MHINDIKESDLYKPIKAHLESNGYSVNAEVLECDVVAQKGDDIINIELKKTFNLQLVFQIIKRQELFESVYVALPIIGNSYPKNFKKINKLLKRLEAGLIFIHFLKTKTRVELVFHPIPFNKRMNRRKQKSIIREITDRVVDNNIAGTNTSTKKITLYRQNAIQVAVFLSLLKEASPAQLKKLGTGNKTQTILANNHYGWFERIKKGIYTLHSDGRQALANYRELVDFYTDLFNTTIKTVENPPAKN